MSYSESTIDERYRLLLLEHYLDGALEAPYKGFKKWNFVCPFCGSLSGKDYKKKEKKGSLLWDARQNSWIFFCGRKRSIECMNGKSFGNLLSALNPAPVTARKDDAPAAVHAALANVAELVLSSAGRGLIQTTAG